MAREIRGVSSTGTLYARILNSAGLWWNGSSFEAYATASYSTYDVAMTEQGNSGVYVADFPSGITTSGTYECYVHRQLGASPAEADPVVNTCKVDWSGTASISAASGAMTGSEFYEYMLRAGFKRTDKATEAYEAITDAIQIMRRRFGFSEAETDTGTTDSISTLGDYKLTLESDFGLLISVLLLNGTSYGKPLTKLSKAEFDELYPSSSLGTYKGYPDHFCIYAEQIYLGPVPDSVSYTYRVNYSKRAGTVTSSTSGVPFTNVYRDVLCDLVQALLYKGLQEYEAATFYKQAFEDEFFLATRKERINQGQTGGNVGYTDF